MKRFFISPNYFISLLAIVAAGGLNTSTVHADISTSGDINPSSDPATWVTSTNPYIGESSVGTMTITDGDTVNDYNANIGYDSGASGTVTVDGVGSTWGNASLYVGRGGTGRLNINNGGMVEEWSNAFVGWGSASIGTVSIDGEGSTWTNSSYLYLGYYGQGTVAIINGGKVINNGAVLGSASIADGTVFVDGVGSTWTNGGTLTLGKSGTGALIITNEGSVSSGDTDVGDDSGSNGMLTVDGEGSSWTQIGYLDVGYKGTGSLIITTGGLVTSRVVEVGKVSGSNGTVTVDGEGSVWDNYSLYLGRNGTGTLNIINGSTVSVTDSTEIGELGSIAFGDNGGSLTTGSLYFSRSQFLGTGTINASGIVGDLDICFDDSHGNEQSFSVDGITLNMSLDTSSALGVGYRSDGSLTIKNSTIVNTNTGHLGYYSSTGIANIKGPGSSWTNNEYLAVGENGTGILAISNSGSVTNSNTYIGRYSDSRGKVFVNGEGSTLASSGLYVGNSGTASLSVTNGGLVSAIDNLVINSLSTVTVDVGYGSALRSGTVDNYHDYSIRNDGIIRLVAGAEAISGTYAPLLCWGLLGRGSVQALGSQWDSAALDIKVADVVTAQGNGGASATIDLAVNQRVLLTDSVTGKSVGAGFLGTDSPNDITFTATTVSNNDLAVLESLLDGTGEQVFSAWNFSVAGYTVSADSPIYVSILAGSTDDLMDLTIWHLVNGEWSQYEVVDLAFNGNYASFVVDSFGGYAVTAAIQTDEYFPGDFDSDGIVSLEDAILALQVTSGMGIVGINKKADIDGDGKIGIAEAVYVIQRVGKE